MTRFSGMWLWAIAAVVAGWTLAADRAVGQKAPAGVRRFEFRLADSPLKDVSREEADRRVGVGAYVKELEGRSDRLTVIKVDYPVLEIGSEALAKLFPKWTFYVVPYSMEKRPGVTEPVSIAFGLYCVLGVDEAGRRYESFGYCNHDEFGTFLAERGVKLRTQAEARAIWTAYCHLYRKASTGELKQVEERRWQMGVQLIDEREYFYPVGTKADGTVESFRLETRLVSKKAA